MSRISVTHAVVPGSEIEKVVEGPPIDITNTEVLALQTTPKTLLAARAGFIPLFEGLILSKAAGVYGGAASTDLLEVRYTDGSGTRVAQIPADGFLTLATAAETWLRQNVASSGGSSQVVLANTPLVLRLSGAVTGATGGALKCRLYYRLVPVA